MRWWTSFNIEVQHRTLREAGSRRQLRGITSIEYSLGSRKNKRSGSRLLLTYINGCKNPSLVPAGMAVYPSIPYYHVTAPEPDRSR